MMRTRAPAPGRPCTGLDEEHLVLRGWMVVVEHPEDAQQDDRHVERHRVRLAPHQRVGADLAGQLSDAHHGGMVDMRCRLP